MDKAVYFKMSGGATWGHALALVMSASSRRLKVEQRSYTVNDGIHLQYFRTFWLSQFGIATVGSFLV
jgi:hypothetical protein